MHCQQVLNRKTHIPKSLSKAVKQCYFYICSLESGFICIYVEQIISRIIVIVNVVQEIQDIIIKFFLLYDQHY